MNLQKYIFLCFYLIQLLSFNGMAGEPPNPLTLQAAFELAVLHSETLGMKEQDVRIAEERYWQAFSGILPKATFVGAERWDDKVNHKVGSVATPAASTSKGSLDSWESRINLKQPLFSGFKEFNAAASAKADGRARTQDLRRARQQLYLDVSEAFYQYLMEQKEDKILAELEASLESRVAELERRETLGRSRTGEVLLAKADLADARANRQATRKIFAATAELLAFLTGIPSSKLHLADTTRLPQTTALQSYLGQAGQRPDVIAATERTTASQRQLSTVKGEHFPTVNVEGNVGLQQEPRTKGNWDVALTLELPLFEGGLIEARVRENKALLRQSELTLAQLQRTADREIRTRHAELNESLVEVVRLRELIDAAEKNKDIQEADYKRGVASNLEALDAVRRFHEARRRLNTSESTAKISLIRLHVAAGSDTTKAESNKANSKP